MFSVILHIIWLIMQSFIGISILVPAAFYLASCIRKITQKELLADEELHEEKDYAIIVSAHSQSEALQALLSSLLQLDYTNYLIYVVVNNTHVTHVTHLSFNNKVVVLPVANTFSNTTRLHRFAIENFKRPHTHVAFFDSSVVDKNYLQGLNVCFHQGYQAVQGRHATQGSYNAYDIIQSANIIYNSFFKNELPFATGASAAIAGSGSAFTIRLYKQCLKKMKVPDNSFAATLQKMIIKRGYQVAFAQHAIVYDGKKAGREQLMQQHAHNINTWLQQLASRCRLTGTGLLHGNRNQLLSGILLLQLPLFTSLIASVFCFAINLWVSPAAAMVWAGLLLLFPLYILLSVIYTVNYYNGRETGLAGDASFQPVVSLYEEEENNYNTIAQTM